MARAVDPIYDGPKNHAKPHTQARTHALMHAHTHMTRFAKTPTYAQNDKECSSSPIDSSINKVTNYHNTTAKS